MRHDEETMLEVLLDWRDTDAVNEAGLGADLGELAVDFSDAQLQDLKVGTLLHRLSALIAFVNSQSERATASDFIIQSNPSHPLERLNSPDVQRAPVRNPEPLFSMSDRHPISSERQDLCRRSDS